VARRRTTEEIRSAVIEAAAMIIDEVGPLRFRMADLFQRANVSESVVYRHFIDRDHLINETLLSMFAAEVESARQATHDYIAWMSSQPMTPRDIAVALAQGFMPASDEAASDAFKVRALKARIAVVALEYPEVHTRFVRLQREMDGLAELLIARIEEHLSNRGWAVNLHSMRFLMNGMKFGLLLEDLDARASGQALSAEAVADLWEAILSRFIGDSRQA
jgi:AcrR family transcriptional regulator